MEKNKTLVEVLNRYGMEVEHDWVLERIERTCLKLVFPYESSGPNMHELVGLRNLLDEWQRRLVFLSIDRYPYIWTCYWRC